MQSTLLYNEKPSKLRGPVSFRQRLFQTFVVLAALIGGFAVGTLTSSEVHPTGSGLARVSEGFFGRPYTQLGTIITESTEEVKTCQNKLKVYRLVCIRGE